MKTAVVILNWNGRQMLERFLPSVVAHTQGDAEIVVADNGSNDDSLPFLAEHYPSLRVIAFDRNYGFAGGYNRALAAIEADIYVLLNDDVEVTEGWIDPIVALFEKEPDVAVVQPKMLMYDDRSRFEYAGGAGGFIDRYGYPFCRGRLFDTIECDTGQYDTPCDIFWASGAALFVRAKVWKAMGGLDDDFFAHSEEIDFCWRVKNSGMKIRYCPQSVVYHVGGGTLPKSSPHKTYLNFRNNRAMLVKNLHDGDYHTILRRRFLLDLLAALTFTLQGKAAEGYAVLRALRDCHRWSQSLKQKRAASTHHPVDGIYQHLLLIRYHLHHERHFSQLKNIETINP